MSTAYTNRARGPLRGDEKGVKTSTPTWAGLGTSPLYIITLSVAVGVASFYLGSVIPKNCSSVEEEYKDKLSLKDKEIKAFEDIYNKIDNKIQKYLDEKLAVDVSETIESLGQGIKQQFDNLHQTTSDAAQRIKTTADSVDQISESFRISTATVQKSVETAAENAEKVLIAAASTVESKAEAWVEQSEKVMADFKDKGSTFLSELEEMKTKVESQYLKLQNEISKATSDLVTKQEESVQRMEHSVTTSVNGFVTNNNKMTTRVEDSVNQMTSKVEESTSSLKETQNTLLEESKANAAKVTEEAEIALKQVKKHFEDIISEINDTAVKHLNTFNQTSQELLGNMQNKSDAVITSLQKSRTKVENQLSESIKDIQKTTKESITDFSTRQLELRNKTENEVIEFSRNIKNRSAEFDIQLVETIGDIKTSANKSIEKLEEAQRQSIKELEVKEQNIIKDIENRGNRVFGELEKTQESWMESVSGIKNNSRIAEKINKQKQDLLETLERQSHSFTATVTHVAQQGDVIGESASKIGQSASSLQHSKENLEHNFDEIKKNVKEMSLPLSLNHYVTWLIAVAGFLWLRFHQPVKEISNERRPATPPDNHDAKRPTNGNRSVIPRAEPKRNIPAGPPVCDITAIAFTAECLNKARILLGSVVSDRSIEYKQISGDQDLSMVRSSRGYVVLIGFDARNAILEDMDGSMGRKKRETITALQQTKGDLLVIYLDNDGAVKAPPERALYNPHLDRTVSHPILRGLTERGRLLTLRNEKWTRHQADHVKAWSQGLKY